MTIFLVVASIGCGKNPEFMACFWGKWWKHMKTPEFCFWKTVIYDDLWILDDCSHVLFFENPCKNWHDLRLLHLFSDCRHNMSYALCYMGNAKKKHMVRLIRPGMSWWWLWPSWWLDIDDFWCWRWRTWMQHLTVPNSTSVFIVVNWIVEANAKCVQHKKLWGESSNGSNMWTSPSTCGQKM